MHDASAALTPVPKTSSSAPTRKHWNIINEGVGDNRNSSQHNEPLPYRSTTDEIIDLKTKSDDERLVDEGISGAEHDQTRQAATEEPLSTSLKDKP
jgi:hypothetical protein